MNAGVKQVMIAIVNLSRGIVHKLQSMYMAKVIVYEEMWRHIAIIYASNLRYVIEKGVFGMKISICIIKYEQECAQ